MVINESETLFSKDIAFIIIFNRMKVEERGELFEVDEDCLQKIFNRMKNYDHIENKRERIIKKATRILAGITYYQPFGEGNKETALSATISYLRKNGFDLSMNTTDQRKDIYGLLNETIWKITNDPTIFGDVEAYLRIRITERFKLRFIL